MEIEWDRQRRSLRGIGKMLSGDLHIRKEMLDTIPSLASREGLNVNWTYHYRLHFYNLVLAGFVHWDRTGYYLRIASRAKTCGTCELACGNDRWCR